MDTFLQDIRHSVRTFLKNPGFTLTAISALALGIGATTAIFSVVNAVLLKPLGIPDPDRLVWLAMSPGSQTDTDASSPAKFMHFRAQTSVLQDVSAVSTGIANYTGGEVVEQWQSARVSADAFRSLEISVLQGRTFTQEEDLPHGPLVAVISRSLWERRFASDPRVLGQSISVNGEPRTVIGIVAGSPAHLTDSSLPVDVYVPFQIDPNTMDQGEYFAVIGRLKPGVTLEQANARLQASTVQYKAKFPDILGPKDSFSAKPYRQAIIGEDRPLVLVLMGAVSLVLLIACANVANLLLARAAGRRREIAIRAAIGAGRARMIRQLLTESVLLSLAGGALGLFLGFAGIRALLAVNTAGLTLVGKDGAAVSLDGRVLAFALAVSLATGIIFGLFPALQGSRADLNAVLKESSGRTGAGLRRNKARAALVVSEVSLAVVLLVGSALLIRTFAALYAVDRGFETKNVLTMRALLAGPEFSKTVDAAGAIGAGIERIRALSGVAAVAATCCLPLADGTYDLNFDILGRPPLGVSNPDVGWAPVSPGYFDVFKIPVKRGRVFSVRDDIKSPAVVVINERMAREYWKDRDPIGQRIIIGGHAGLGSFKDEPVRQVIGIVGDVRDEGLSLPPRPILYVPQAQLPHAANAFFLRDLPVAWVVRTQADPHALIPAIREELRQATGLPVSGISTMDEVLRRSTSRQRFNMLLMTVFGCAALLLAAIGIYGLMAYTVEQRKQEIGIRLALGANAANVRIMVVREGMSLALAGAIAGIAAAMALTRLIASFLFGVKARDPVVFFTVPVVLSAVAFLAVWLPANRASRVDPVDALRHD